MSKKLLAGIAAATFLRRYWQKEPLLSRRTLTRYGPLLDRNTLFALATRTDMQSRVVSRSRGRWNMKHGPFSRSELARLPATGWTLLVQGIDLILPQMQGLLREFSCIPYARFDDIMVSYAPPGGGVGPHFDSYDVFLLQLSGRRRWQISKQRDLSLVEQLPLKILKRFRSEREWIMDPGDLLYLPPYWAHDGVAIDHSLTCSIGFRAPAAQEIGTRFLEYLQDRLALEGHYRDPGLKLQRHPAQIGIPMLRQMQRIIGRISWNNADTEQFIGQYLTEPKPHVIFERPRRPLTSKSFRARIAQEGLRLALQTRMLHRSRWIFINGEGYRVPTRAARELLQLADRRRLAAGVDIGGETVRLLYRWYRAGYIEMGHDRPGSTSDPARSSHAKFR